MASGLVFATVGTTKFDSFVEILTQSDVLNELKNRGYKKLRIQIGNGDIPKLEEAKKLGLDVSYYRFKPFIKEDIEEAELVISHAGAGSCLEVLEQKKPLLVVINEDLMNNHQTELAEQLSKDGHLYFCTKTTLKETIKNMNLQKLKPLPDGNPDAFIKFLDRFMGFSNTEE